MTARRAGWTMARRWLVVAVTLLALGGCGDEPETEPATVPVPATSSAAPEPTTLAARTRTGAAAPGTGGFVAGVQRTLPQVAVDRRDEELAALGEQACTALAAGNDTDAVLAEMAAFGTGDATARALVRLAIGTVCPDQDRRLGDF